MAVISKLQAVLTLQDRQFQAGMAKAQTTTQKLGSTISSLGKTIGIAFAVGAVINFAKVVLDAYDTQIKAEAKLLGALKGRRDVQETLIKQAEQLQKITLFGDEQTIEAQAMLAAFGLTEDAILRLTPLVLDFATVYGMNLSQASTLVGKSLGSSTNALSRYGIEISGAVGSVNRLEKAVLGLNKQVGGQSVIAAEAGTGAITQLGNAWGDLLESLGALIATPGFIKGIEALTEFLQTGSIGAGLEAWVRLLGKTGLLFAGIVEALEYIGVLDDLEAQAEDTAKALVKIPPPLDDPKTKPKKVEPPPLTLGQVEALSEATINQITLKAAEYLRILGDIDKIQDPFLFEKVNTEGERLGIVLDDIKSSGVEIKDSFDKTSESITVLAENMVYLGDVMKNILQSAFTGLANTLVDIVEGKNILDAFADFISQMGRMMATYGALLLAQGIAQKAFEHGEAYTKIVAGAAMLALGIAVAAGGAAINRSGSSGSAGSSGGSSGAGGGFGGGYDYSREVVFTIAGSDLIAVMDFQQSKDNKFG